MITIESHGSNINIFSRDKDGNPTASKVTDFKPYFYVKDEEGSFTSIEGHKAKKIQFENPWDAKELKNRYDMTFEADVQFSNKYIIDRISEMKQVPIRKCYLDIEVAKTTKGYEAPGLGNNPIISICCYDSEEKEYKIFCINKTHQDERTLLIDFIKYIRETNPDLLIGWNSDEFDMPVIIKRIEKLLPENKISIARIAPEIDYFGKCKLSFGRFANPKVGGRELFDLMKAYKKISQGGRESWSLDYISRYELKDEGGKEEYTGDLDDLFRDDLELFIKYNIRDVELLVMLDEKLRMVEFFDEVRRLCFCKIGDVFQNSKIIDCLCLKYAKDNNFILPSVTQHEKTPYEGGFVGKSEAKLHKNIACMDYRSLYPSIIIAWNVSYETVLEKMEEGCTNGFDKYYFSDKKAIIPSIIRPLLDGRKEAKKLEREAKQEFGKDSNEAKAYNMKQLALKIISNAIYGVTAFRNFRLYNQSVAEAITYIARNSTKVAMDWWEEHNHKVIYSDTDSVFVQMNDKTIEEMIEMNKEFNIYLHDFLRKMGVKKDNDLFEMEFEKVYRTLFFKMGKDGKGCKKKYCGLKIWEG